MYSTEGVCRGNKADKDAYVEALLKAKQESGKTFTDIAREVGVTSAYLAQLLYGQAQLSPRSEGALRRALPALSDQDIATLKRVPMRRYDPALLQDPFIYRLNEAVTHYGEGIRAVVTEELGDGIMSAIDMFVDVRVIQGASGEKRIAVIFNGKFLPHIEQLESQNTFNAQLQQMELR